MGCDNSRCEIMPHYKGVFRLTITRDHGSFRYVVNVMLPGSGGTPASYNGDNQKEVKRLASRYPGYRFEHCGVPRKGLVDDVKHRLHS